MDQSWFIYRSLKLLELLEIWCGTLNDSFGSEIIWNQFTESVLIYSDFLLIYEMQIKTNQVTSLLLNARSAFVYEWLFMMKRSIITYRMILINLKLRILKVVAALIQF